MENTIKIEHLERPTKVLSAEHRIIERALTVLEKLTGAPVKASLEDWKKTLEFMRHFADRCHHSKEEKILFPAIEHHGISRENGPIGIMLLEHEEARSYLRSMAAALDLCTGNNEAAQKTLVQSAKAYSRRLREHIQNEAKVLFRIADCVIPADEQVELLRALEEYEAKEMREGVHAKYLRLLEELEASNS